MSGLQAVLQQIRDGDGSSADRREGEKVCSCRRVRLNGDIRSAVLTGSDNEAVQLVGCIYMHSEFWPSCPG